MTNTNYKYKCKYQQEGATPNLPTPCLPGLTQCHRGCHKVPKILIRIISGWCDCVDHAKNMHSRLSGLFEEENNNFIFSATFPPPTLPQWFQVSTSQMLQQISFSDTIFTFCMSQ